MAKPGNPYIVGNVVQAMTFGVNRPIHARGKTIPPGTPLDMKTACKATGVRYDRMLTMPLTERETFAKALQEQMSVRRLLAEPATLAALLEMRDGDRDDHSPARDQLRLQAIEEMRRDPTVPLELLRRKRLGYKRPPRRYGATIRLRPF